MDHIEHVEIQQTGRHFFRQTSSALFCARSVNFAVSQEARGAQTAKPHVHHRRSHSVDVATNRRPNHHPTTHAKKQRAP